MGVVVLAAAFLFSLVLFAVLLGVGLIAGAYLWWKTRGLRRQLRESVEAARRTAPSTGLINALSSSPKARVRVGRACSVGDSGEELGRSPRLTLAEQVPSRSCGHGSSNWAAAAQPRACRPPREGR
jgi:hypothetical protein